MSVQARVTARAAVGAREIPIAEVRRMAGVGEEGKEKGMRERRVVSMRRRGGDVAEERRGRVLGDGGSREGAAVGGVSGRAVLSEEVWLLWLTCPSDCCSTIQWKSMWRYCWVSAQRERNDIKE